MAHDALEALSAECRGQAGHLGGGPAILPPDDVAEHVSCLIHGRASLADRRRRDAEGLAAEGSDAISPPRVLSTACRSAAGASSTAVSERDTGVGSCVTASTWPVSTASATARTELDPISSPIRQPPRMPVSFACQLS